VFFVCKLSPQEILNFTKEQKSFVKRHSLLFEQTKKSPLLKPADKANIAATAKNAVADLQTMQNIIRTACDNQSMVFGVTGVLTAQFSKGCCLPAL
jgi:hypothetical protein